MQWASNAARVANEPAGYDVWIRPGWTFFSVQNEDASPWPQQEDAIPVDLGLNRFPQFFEIEVRDSRITAEEDVSDALWVVLGYQWDGEAFDLSGFYSFTPRADQSMARLLELGDVPFWRQKALLHLALFGSSDGRAMNPRPSSEWSASEIAQARRRGESALALPNASRKDRVTAEVLAEAAEVYRVAWREGRNPTQAVEKHFSKSHSTAARWVGQARRIGLLGPADGSRGGEVGPVDMRLTDE